MDNTCVSKTDCFSMLKEKIKGNLLNFAGALLGAIGGYLYYRFAGCKSGTCPITSNPWISTFWGTVTGILFAGLFTTNKKNEKNEKEHGID